MGLDIDILNMISGMLFFVCLFLIASHDQGHRMEMGVNSNPGAPESGGIITESLLPGGEKRRKVGAILIS